MLKKQFLIICLAFCASMPLTGQNYPNDTTSNLLDEVHVYAKITNTNTSPLRIKVVTEEQIRSASFGKTYPELIGSTPGVYATSESGSYGDARINIRGFKQENISVLLNGVPISGLTSGSMYWNNWMGLSDATASIQLQKGIGGSMLSDNSVGGTIDIITSKPLKSRSIRAGYYCTEYGMQKGYVEFNSGELQKGWSVIATGSYARGKGFVECTDINSWSYLFSAAKKINKSHSFIFTALGSPEQHSQRSQRITYDEKEKYGVGYNKNWGWYTEKEGKSVKRTISRNSYYKPYFMLSHFMEKKTAGGVDVKVSTSAYLAIGKGGGYFTETKGKKIISFQKDGHIDWESVIRHNTKVPHYQTLMPAINIMSRYNAGHTQFGIASSSIFKFNDRVTLDAGIHYQLYKTMENENIEDLLGADYWYEDYQGKSISGLAGRNPYKKEGDFIRTDNGRNQNYVTVYAMGTFNAGNSKNWIIKLGTSLSGTSIRRWDRYNYPDNKYSKLVVGEGGSIKTGILYKYDMKNSFYLNGAAYSRIPYYNVFFSGGGNNVSIGVKNENNYLGEAGYRFVGEKWWFEVTFYSAYWKNKTIVSPPYKQLQSNENYKYIVTGLDAFHYGIESDIFYNISNIIKINAFVSFGDWRWKNDVSAIIYEPYSMIATDTINVYCNGIHVGDAPQTQIGASFEIFPFGKGGFKKNEFSIKAGWNYAGRFWADFEPAARTDKTDRSDSYRIPSYNIFNLNIGFGKPVTNRLKIRLFCNADNLFNADYIERGRDGKNHDRNSFTGYWGNKRNFNFGVRMIF